MSHIILVSGGVKSGKSEFAEYLASKEKNVTYIALLLIASIVPLATWYFSRSSTN